MAYDPQPTLAGFILFIRGVMGITAGNLPDNSPVIPMALSVALSIVNPALACAGYAPGISGTVPVSIYTLAVYNLAGDNVINYAPDPTMPPGTSVTYFTDLRTSFNINAFVSGVIQSSYDETTGNTMVVQKAAENFTLGDLQNLKTPWGRTYLAFAQRYGSLVGSS